MPDDHVASLPPANPQRRAEAYVRRAQERQEAYNRGRDQVIEVRPCRMQFDTRFIVPRVRAPAAQTGAVTFSAESYSGNEGTTIPFTIQRAGNVTQQLQVDWAITGVSSATPSSGRVRFNAGDLIKTINVTAGLVATTEVGSLAVTVTALSDTGNPPTSPSPVTFSVLDVASDLPPVIISTPLPVFTQGIAGSYDMKQHVSDDGVSSVTYSISGILATGLSFNSASGILGYDGIGPTSDTSHTLTATDAIGSDTSSSFSLQIVDSVDLELDWQSRISGTGVVWYHDFRDAAEVDAFRWRGLVGNDPNNVSSVGGTVIHQTTDGVTGGGCLQLTRAVGNDEPGSWWRPFSPMTAPGNGKSTDDPGASGTLPPQEWNPTQGGSQTQNWGHRGYYGHDSYHGSGAFDGTGYFLQFRFKMDPRRSLISDSVLQNAGKVTYHSVTAFSLSQQELVTYSRYFNVVEGEPIYPRIYGGGGISGLWNQSDPLDQKDNADDGNHPGTEFGTVGDGTCRLSTADARLANCWSYGSGWNTIMYQIVPGRDEVDESIIRVYVAYEGQRDYTKIWDMTWPNNYEIDPLVENGYNALIASVYCNGRFVNQEFWHRYDQMVFSKAWIPPPSGAPDWFLALDHLEWGTPVGNWLGDSAVIDPLAGVGSHGTHASIITEWTGMLADQERRTIGMVANGGHDSYYGNEVYSCDLHSNTPLWTRRRNATPAEGQGVVNTIYEFTDNTPASTHTNNALISANGRWFLLGLTGSMYIGSSDERRCWEYDPLTESYINLGSVGATSSSFGTCSMFYPQGPDGGLLIRASQDYTAYQSLNNPDVLYEQGGGTSGNGDAICGDVDTDNHIMLTMQLVGVNTYRWRRLDSTAARTGASTVIASAGGPVPTFNQRIAIHYHPDSQSFLTWGGDSTIRQLVPTVSGGSYTALNWISHTTTGVIPPLVELKMYNKIQLIRDMGNGDAALVVVPRYGNPDVYVCRIKAGML